MESMEQVKYILQTEGSKIHVVNTTEQQLFKYCLIKFTNKKAKCIKYNYGIWNVKIKIHS